MTDEAIDASRRSALVEWRRFVIGESHYLCEHPEALFQQAGNQPVVTAPARSAERPRDRDRTRQRPWLRWLNKPERPSACRLTLAGHERGVTSARFVGAGGRVVSQGLDGTLRLWDAGTGVQLAVFPCRYDSNAASISSDGRLAAVELGEGDLSIRDLVTGTELGRFTGLWWVESCWFLPGNRQLIVTDHSEIWVCTIGDAHDRRRLAEGQALDLSSDGRLVRRREARLDIVDAETGGVIVALGEVPNNARMIARFSPDAAFVVAAAGESLRIWDSASGSLLASCTCGGFNVLAIAPDAALLATGSLDGTLRLSSFPSLELVAETRAHRQAVLDCAFFRDRSLVTASADGTAKLWDVPSLAVAAILSGHRADVTVAAFSPDGQSVLTASRDATLRIWETAAAHRPTGPPGHQGPIVALGFAVDVPRLASASRDGTLKVWNLESGAEVSTFATPESTGVNDCAISQDGCTLAAAADGAIVVWSVADPHGGQTLPIRDKRILSCCFSPDGRHLATGDDRGSVALWDLQSKSIVAALEAGDEPITSTAFLRHGRWIGWRTLFGNGVWDPEGNRNLGPSAGVIAGSPDGRWLALRDGADKLRIIDFESGGERHGIGDVGGEILACKLSPGARYVALVAPASAGPGLYLGDLSAGGPAATPRLLHRNPDGRFMFSPDGRRLSIVAEGTVVVWRLPGESIECILRLPRHAAERRLSLWDDETEGHRRLPVHCAWSPAGRLLATCSGEARIVVWTATGRRLTELPAATSVSHLRWSPDGRGLTAASPDGSVLILALEGILPPASRSTASL